MSASSELQLNLDSFCAYHFFFTATALEDFA